MQELYVDVRASGSGMQELYVDVRASGSGMQELYGKENGYAVF
jgi:hypothetical protein